MDSTQLQILPLTVIMVLGTQFLVAIFLVTSYEPVKNSGAMLVGVFVATSLSLLIWFGLYEALSINPGSSSDSSPSTADWVVSGLLVLAGIHTFLTRHTAGVPKWMSGLQKADPKSAFTLAFLLFLLMPPDIVAVIAAVHWLHVHNDGVLHAWPLVAACTLAMALPILGYLLFGRRAREAMPKIRDWMTTNAWVVNIAVIAFYLYELLK